MDVFTPEKRSEVMSRIRGRDTKPELSLRKMLHGLGYRFTVNGPKNRTLPGRPDFSCVSDLVSRDCRTFRPKELRTESCFTMTHSPSARSDSVHGR